MIELTWAGRQPRLAWEILTLPLDQGGLAAPDLPLYAYCAQALFLQYWVYPTPYQPHVAIEIDRCAPLPLNTALYAPYKRPKNELDTVQTLRWAWKGLQTRANLPHIYAPQMPLKNHPQLPAFNNRTTWARAASHGLATWGDLYPNGQFMSLNHMCQPELPSTADVLLYGQIRAACSSANPLFPASPLALPALEHILTVNSDKKLITRLYRNTQQHFPVTTAKARDLWDGDLDMALTDKQWQSSCHLLSQLTVNHKLRLIHFKYLHRTYRTPRQLYRIGLRDNSQCWKCGHSEADFLHMTWQCHPIAKFWDTILRYTKEITGLTIPASPLATLLGVLDPLPLVKTKLAGILLLMAKRQIALHWGTPTVPTAKEWLQSVTFCQIQITAYWELQPARLRPKDIWSPFVYWLSTHTFED